MGEVYFGERIKLEVGGRIKDGGRLNMEVCWRLNRRLGVFGIMGLVRRVIDWNLE